MSKKNISLYKQFSHTFGDSIRKSNFIFIRHHIFLMENTRNTQKKMLGEYRAFL